MHLLRSLNNCTDAVMNPWVMILWGSDIDIATIIEVALFALIKRLAVIPVAVSVRRADLHSMKQHDGENACSFYARIKGKAATCAHTIQHSSHTCTQTVDFTDVIVKDVIIAGIRR